MDSQLKKGFLEFLVLGALYNRESYGYQIIKDISPCIEISESTLYPILKRLEANKFVETHSVEHNGRLRKYYYITESGKARAREFLDDWQQLLQIYEFLKGAIEHE